MSFGCCHSDGSGDSDSGVDVGSEVVVYVFLLPYVVVAVVAVAALEHIMT